MDPTSPEPGHLFQPPSRSQDQPVAEQQGFGQLFQPPAQPVPAAARGARPGQSLDQLPEQLPEQPPDQLPPARFYSGRTPLWPFAVGVFTLAVTAASYWIGTYLAVYRPTGVNVVLLLALIGATAGGLVAVWSDRAYEVRTWGSDLFGKTLLGWRRVDLANLTSAKLETFLQRSSFKLGDSRGRIVVPGKKLPPIIDSVRRGVSEAAERGQFVVTQRLAVQLGLPVQEGARKKGAGKGGTGNILLVFGVLCLIGFGLILGAAVAS